MGLRTRTRNLPFLLLSAGLSGAAVMGIAPPAEACGGFWCSQASPVNQTAEQIIFSRNADNTVTCVVQIAYAGPSEHFAWLLPIAGVPILDVSSDTAFERLGQATQPQYVLDRHVDGQCRQDYPAYATGGTGGSASFSPGVDASAPPVQLLAQGSVGPYDYSVIQVDRTLADPAGAALAWLTQNGYDVTGVSSSVLGPYLADGLNILAMKLTKGNETGTIRPVIVTYPGDKPSIPIRPTAVAAENDMGILVWVLADHQAVPQNYRSLILNEALIDWFNPLANYDQVVTAAANEAGGQGFVTEYADSSSAFSQTVYSASEAQGWAEIQQQTYADPIDLLWAANAYFRGWDGWRETIEASVTLPDGVSLDAFAGNPDAYRGIAVVDENTFRTLLYTNVIHPVEHTQQLVNSRPYMTRLYSTMSPDEMTLDPVFTFNPDLADVSNLHTAELYVACNPDVYEWEAPWRLVLPQGGTLYGTGQSGSWPIAIDDSMPANFKVVQLGESGSGEIIENNSVTIASALVAGGGTYTPPRTSPPSEGMPIGGYDGPVDLSPDSSMHGGGCGCSVPAREQGAMGAAFVALVLGTLTRGRRRFRASKS